eukprot:535913_1
MLLALLIVVLYVLYKLQHDEVVDSKTVFEINSVAQESMDTVIQPIRPIHTYNSKLMEIKLIDLRQLRRYTAPPEGKKDVDVVAIVISVSVAAVGCLIAAILRLVYYKRHLACFKIEWDTEKSKALNRDPGHIYKNPKEVGKKGKKKMMITDIVTTPNLCVNPHHLPM